LELQQFVCVLGVIAGVASIYGGFRLFLGGAAGNGEPQTSPLGAQARPSKAALGTFFLVLGVVFITSVATTVVNGWRNRESWIFPMHILNLEAPPAAIEAVKPSSSPPSNAPPLAEAGSPGQLQAAPPPATHPTRRPRHQPASLAQSAAAP
jgi:hypothetical protein